MENICTKGLEKGGNLLKPMRDGLPIVNDSPAQGEVRQGTAAAAAAGDVCRALGAAVAAAIRAIRHAATYGFHLWSGALLPGGCQRQQQGAEKRHPEQEATPPNFRHNILFIQQK